MASRNDKQADSSPIATGGNLVRLGVVVAVEQEHELVAGLAESLAVLAQHLGDLD